MEFLRTRTFDLHTEYVPNEPDFCGELFQMTKTFVSVCSCAACSSYLSHAGSLVGVQQSTESTTTQLASRRGACVLSYNELAAAAANNLCSPLVQTPPQQQQL